MWFTLIPSFSPHASAGHAADDATVALLLTLTKLLAKALHDAARRRTPLGEGGEAVRFDRRRYLGLLRLALEADAELGGSAIFVQRDGEHRLVVAFRERDVGVERRRGTTRV